MRQAIFYLIHPLFMSLGVDSACSYCWEVEASSSLLVAGIYSPQWREVRGTKSSSCEVVAIMGGSSSSNSLDMSSL